MITRTLTQVKVFDVKTRQDVMYEQGMQPWVIPGLTWVNGQVWESDAKCERCLNEAIADWRNRRDENPWGTTSHKPELVVYWQTIAVDENNS
jgi:hypothetical protein